MHIHDVATLEQVNQQAVENKYLPIEREWELTQPKELMGH
jgi:hypothetical protein